MSGLPETALQAQTEIELKFLVPRAARARVLAEMARGSGSPERKLLSASYFDTDDRRLARAGMAWRLRREGRRWVQTLKAGTSNPLERFEHEVIRPDASTDASEHAGTPVGDRLATLLRRARAEGIEPAVRYRTEVRRTIRRIRTRGAIVEVAFDEGRLIAAGGRLTLSEIEFELVSGSPPAMLALAERWRKRFDLIYDPRSKAERGDGLAEGERYPSVRKARPMVYSRDAAAIEAFGIVIDECLAQITRNAVGLIDGDPDRRIEHVHQLRVGIRRLRSALRCFRGWVPVPPEPLVQGLRALFLLLGKSRDSDVLAGGVVADLARAGGPATMQSAVPSGPDPAEAVRAADTQRMLLAWIAWRTALAQVPLESSVTPEAKSTTAYGPAAGDGAAADPESSGLDLADSQSPQAQQHAATAMVPCHDPRTFHRQLRRRLRRWHARFASDWKSFDDLDEAGLHALRKRIKRQRYAVECFAPVMRKRRVGRSLAVLSVIQNRMGALNDLFVARARYQAQAASGQTASDPAVWFALGWLAARIADLRALAKPDLGKLAKSAPPTA